jgi:acyl-CoA thioester hydrolase
MKPEPFRLRRAAYPYVRTVPARFGDMDEEGHLNNVALAGFYEEARVSFLRHYLKSKDGQDFRFVIANMNISYLAEAHYPGDYDIGVGVSRIGNTSFGLGAGLFLGDACLGVMDTVQVVIQNDRPACLPAQLREGLGRHALNETR